MSSPMAPDGLRSPKGKAWLRARFNQYNLSRSNRLTLGEFIHLTKTLDATLTTEQCEMAFDSLDPAQRGAVDFEAFSGWWTTRAPR